MRKDALTMVLITAVAGIFGAFLRWLENINAFEPDTGLMLPFARTTALLTAFLLAAAAAFAVLSVVWTKRFACEKTLAGLQTRTLFPDLLCKLCGVVLIVLGVVLMFAAPEQRYPSIERFFSSFCIFCGVSLMFIMARPGGAAYMGRGTSLIPVLFSCVWLVSCYKNNAENPVVWSYLVELLTVAATIMAWYELAAYHYSRAKPAAALFFVQAAAFMNLTTLADERPVIMSVLFAIQAALMLMYEFTLVENFTPRRARRAAEPET